MPSFTAPNLPNFDLPKFDLPKFDLPKFDLPKLDLSKFDVTKLDLPKFDLPTFDVPEIDVDRVAGVVRDAAYVGIGLAVLAVQRVQTARRDATASVERQARRVRDLLPA
jgi:hypothetical protein